MDPIDSGRLDWIYSGDLTDQGLTSADLSTLARILARPCPHCRAPIGAWCRTSTGQPIDRLDDQHTTRRRPHIG